MATKKKAKAKTVFVLPDGTQYNVTGETGKYIICGDVQFRKSANRGKVVNLTNASGEDERKPEKEQ